MGSAAMLPLKDGEHLDRRSFHERYEAMPEDFRAELIDGVVHLRSRQASDHGRTHLKLSRWIGEFADATPGLEAISAATLLLGSHSEPEPDGCLLIVPEFGGQTWEESEYLAGAPEWIGEISDSTESIDLNSKKTDYEQSGVREYMVAAVRSGVVFWFVRQRGKFKELKPDADGIFRSQIFPGLWLDPDALLKRNGKRLLAVLRQGLASPEHAAFVAKLAAKKG